MIAKWIEGVLTSAVQQGVLEERNKRIVGYGLFVAYNLVSSLLAIILLGIPFGLSKLALAAAATGGLFRFVSGGAHFASSVKCLVFTAIAFNVEAFVARLTASMFSLPSVYASGVIAVFVAVSLTLGIRVVDSYVPVDTAHRPISTKEEKEKFRLLSYTFVFAFTIVFITLTFFLNAWEYALAMWFAYGFQLLSLTPRAEKVFKRIERQFE